jgi:hypothetical protein
MGMIASINFHARPVAKAAYDDPSATENACNLNTVPPAAYIPAVGCRESANTSSAARFRMRAAPPSDRSADTAGENVYRRCFVRLAAGRIQRIYAVTPVGEVECYTAHTISAASGMPGEPVFMLCEAAPSDVLQAWASESEADSWAAESHPTVWPGPLREMAPKPEPREARVWFGFDGEPILQ